MTTIKLRRGTASEWTAANPILDEGEPGFEEDTGKLKIGNGTQTWSALQYILDQDDLAAYIASLDLGGGGGPFDISDITGLSGALSSLTGMDTSLDNRLDTAEAALTALDTRADALEAEDIALDTRLTTVEGLVGGSVDLSNLVTQEQLADSLTSANLYTDDAIDAVKLQFLSALDLTDAPENFTVVLIGKTSVQLSWDAVPDADGYRVMRDGVQVGADLTVTTLDDTGLAGQTSYTYTVHAFNANGDGLDTIEKVVLTLTPDVPPSPVLRSTVRTDTSITLDWDPVTSDGYHLYMDGVQQGGDLDDTDTPYNITGLTAGTPYLFEVVAYNTDGDSPTASLTISTTSDTPVIRGSFENADLSAITTTVSATLPTGIQTGDSGLLILQQHNTAITLTTAPAGWTLEDSFTLGTNIVAYLYRRDMVAGDSGTTVSAIFSAATRPSMAGVIIARGVSIPDVLVRATDNTSDATPDFPAITPTNPNTRLIALVAARWGLASGNTIGFPAGYTKHAEAGSNYGTTPQNGVAVASKPRPGAAALQAAESGTYPAGNNGFDVIWMASISTDPGVPGPVQNLRVTSKSSTAVALAWDAVTGATSYQITKNGVALGAAPTSPAYSDATGNTPGATNTYAVRAVNGAGIGPSSGTISVTLDATAGRFPGDPGVNNIIIGATVNQYSLDWFDKRIFPGATSSDPPTKRFKTARLYLQPTSAFGVNANFKTKLIDNANAGRVTMYSHKGVKEIDANATYSFQDIIDGLADAEIDAAATFFNTLVTPIIYTFIHEPEVNIMLGKIVDATNRTRSAKYRQAFRYIINRMTAIAPTKICFASPFYTSGVWNASNGAWNDMRWFHPNWTGAADGGGSWLNDGPFTAGGSAGSWVHVDGIDLYNPTTPGNQNATSDLKSWNSKANDFLNKRIALGMRELPWCCGELGVYNNVQNLIATGVDAQDFIQDMIEIGAATEHFFGAVFWNAGLAAFDDAADVYPTGSAADRKTKGLRDAINTHARVKML